MRSATSMGGMSVAPARWPAFHSWTSRVSIRAAPASISCWASAGETSRRPGLSDIVGCPCPLDPAGQGVAQRIERQHGALEARRTDFYAEVVQHILPAKVRNVRQRAA